MRIIGLITFLALIYVSTFSTHAAIFLPEEQIKSQPLGPELLELHKQAESQPNVVYQTLTKLMATANFKDNSYYLHQYYITLIKLELARSAPQAAELAADEMLQVAAQKKLAWFTADAYLLKAIFAAKQGKIDIGVKLVNQAIHKAQASQYQYALARSYNLRGVFSGMQSHYYAAQEDYLRALKLLEAYPRDRYVASVLSNISVTYMNIEDWEQTLFYNKKAIAAYENSKQESIVNIAKFYLNAAIAYQHLKETDKATEAINQALTLAVKSNNLEIKASSLAQLADQLIEKTHYKEAIEHALQCLIFAEQSNNAVSRANCNAILGKGYLQSDELDLAFHHLELSMADHIETKNLIGQTENYKWLSKAYEMKSDYQNALQFFQRYNEMNTELLFSNRQKQLFHLEQQYDAETKFKAIELLNVENNLKTAEINQQNLKSQLYILVILLTFMTVIVFYFRNKALTKKSADLTLTNQTLYKQSHHDALTGCFNRRHLDSLLPTLLAEDQIISYVLAILDIDYFKAVNDQHGHDIGDQVLIAVSDCIARNLCSRDVLVRWGGEEFVILVKQKRVKEYESTLERVRAAIEDLVIDVEKIKLKITASIGHTEECELEVIKSQYHEQIEYADKALYKAKENGRNCIEGFKVEV